MPTEPTKPTEIFYYDSCSVYAICVATLINHLHYRVIIENSGRALTFDYFSSYTFDEHEATRAMLIYFQLTKDAYELSPEEHRKAYTYLYMRDVNFLPSVVSWGEVSRTLRDYASQLLDRSNVKTYYTEALNRIKAL